MKLTIIALLLTSTAALVAGDDTAPAASGQPQGLDIGSTVLATFSEVTKQINSMQSVLSQLNIQLNRMITTSTRLIAGPELHYSQAGDNGISSGGLAGSLFDTFNRMTGQLTAVQGTMQQLSQQLQRVLESSTRMLTGPSLYQATGSGDNNFVESVLRTLESWAKQLQQMNNVLRQMNGQWNRIVETGTRIITGPQSALYADGNGDNSGSGNPFAGLPINLPSGLPGIEQIQQLFGLVGQQVVSLQRVLMDFSGQLTRMISSNRGIGPLHQQPFPDQPTGSGQAESAAAGGSSPADSLLNILNLLTNQFSQVQRVLADLNGQMSRMLETGSRALG